MSVKTRCSECRKKISVDEAFAGSMCRCPYCKSIVIVPRSLGGTVANGARPSRPNSSGPTARPKAPAGRPGGSGLQEAVGSRPILSGDLADVKKQVGPAQIDRPAAPQIPVKKTPAPVANGRQTLPVDEKQLTREQLEHIPTANPVMVQGLTSLALILVLLIMVGASVYLGVLVFATPAEEQAPPPPTEEELTTAYRGEDPNPFLTAGKPMVAGDIAVQAPVAYVIDTGSRMGADLPLAIEMSLASARSLPGDAQAGVILAKDPEVELVGGSMKPAREIAGLAEALEMVMSSGASDLQQAVQLAVDSGAKTVVLLVSGKSLDDPDAIGQAVSKAGAKLVLIGMMPIDDQQRANWRKAVDTAGNGATLRVYDVSRYLVEWYQERNEN